MTDAQQLYSYTISTPLGDMIAIASVTHLYMLRFADCTTITKECQQLEKQTACSIIPGEPLPITLIKKELNEYFTGKLKKFTTPCMLTGTVFQQQTWTALQKSLYNSTQSYTHLATLLNKPSAFRAVANANGANKLAIIIPCHRIIGKNGSLHGYNGGIERKQWLLLHEKNGTTKE